MSQRHRTLAAAFGSGALVLALLSTGLVWQLADTYDAAIEAASERERVHVALATRDLYPGIVITADDFVLTAVDPDWLPGASTAGLFTKPEALIGRAPKQRILANEYIPEARLADFQTGEGLNGLIPPGMRAMSLPVRDAAALGGLLEPGAHVDIIANVEPEQGGQPVAHTLAYKVFVLAVNGRARTPEDLERRRRGRAPKPTVTLLVDRDLAALVAHASALGEITLAGVNPNETVEERPLGWGFEVDTAEPETEGTLVERVPVEPVVEEPPPPPETLTICKGTDCHEHVIEAE